MRGMPEGNDRTLIRRHTRQRPKPSFGRFFIMSVSPTSGNGKKPGVPWLGSVRLRGESIIDLSSCRRYKMPSRLLR